MGGALLRYPTETPLMGCISYSNDRTLHSVHWYFMIIDFHWSGEHEHKIIF